MHAARNRSVVALSLVASAALSALAAASCSKCSKNPPGDADAAPEGGSVADAGVDAATDAAPEAAAGDAGTAPLAATATAARVPGGPFEGTYQCFGGLTLRQNGNLVSGVIVNRLSTSTQTTQWNCSVVRPDHCEGVEVVTVRFNDPKKTPKAPESRKLTIEHKPDGVSVHLERSTETTFCKK
jgi:hypothetical protein